MRQISKEDFVRIFVVLAFVLGFFVLISFDSSIIGFVSSDFDSEAVSLGIGNAANWPYNMSGNVSLINRWQDVNRQVNFTYNVSTDQNHLDNCTLWMDIDDAGFEANETLNRSAITQVINQTINETFQSGIHKIIWKIGCYDDAYAQTNTSARNLYLNYLVTQSAPNIGAHAWYDENYVVMQHRFEEFDGTTFLDETGLNNGTRKGGTKWCPAEGDSQKYNCSGRVGKGVSFDGGGDYINLSNIATELSSISKFTISFWMNQKVLDRWEYIFAVLVGSTNDIQVYTYSDGNFYFEVGNAGDGYGEFDYSTVISAGQWHHVVEVFDGTQTGNANRLNVYVDGKPVSLTFHGAAIPSSTADLSTSPIHAIGYVLASFNGTLDEFTIWNRSLSSEEVKQLYYMSNSTFTIQDISASNNNTQDEDNDTIKFIYDWYVNNESMAVLNMPFEAVNNGSEMNFSKDYSSNESHGSTNFNSDVYESGSGWNRTGGYDGFGAYEFDGINDYIVMNDTSLSIQTGSWGAWIYKIGNKTSVTSAHVINKRNTRGETYALLYNRFTPDFGKMHCSVRLEGSESTTRGAYSNSPLKDGEWHHYFCTYDGDKLRIYVDGVLQTDVDDTDGTIDIDNPRILMIGDHSQYPGNVWNGSIDEVMIFNRSLSAEQIKALYYNQTQTIKSQETVKGQSWKAEVTANDGYGDSIEYNTSEIIIDDVTLVVGLQAPVNHYNTTDRSISFTYNVTDLDSVVGVINCSLWLYNTTNYWSLNSTEDYPEVNINQTYNLTFDNCKSMNWTVACYDKDQEQTNSSSYKLNIQCVEREGGGGIINRRVVKSSYLEMSIPKTMEFNLPGLPIISTIITLNRDALLDLSASIILESFIENKLDNVYAYFELNSNLENDYFDSILINFKVKKSYDNVGLYQLFDQGNYEIEITQIYEDKEYIYYQAPLNSLGYFAITGNKIEEDVFVAKSENEIVADFDVNTTSTIILVVVLVFIILTIVAIVILIYLIKFKPKGKIPINKEVRFKLLARIIINKLNAGRVMEVDEDYNKLIILYKRIIVGKEEFEIRGLYNIIENVYEKYYSEIMKLHRKL